MRSSGTRALVPALLVLGLIAVVAIAATGSTSTGSDRVRPPAATLLDTILTLGMLGVLAGGVLVAYGLMQRKDISREIATGRYRRTSLVGWILFVLVFTLFMYWRMKKGEFGPTEEDVSDVVRGLAPPLSSTPGETSDSTYEPRIAWIPIAVVLGLAAAGVVAYLVSQRRAKSRARARDDLAETVAALIDDTLDDLRAEADARRAVIAAYARLESVLAAHGLPRRRAETQDEYLSRLLEGLSVPADPARRLTELFERAKFSQHAVDTRMKEEAIGALEDVRDELRRANAVREMTASAAKPVTGGAPS